MTVDVFVGREEELRRLSQSYQRARAGELQVLFVAGEAGSGKSTLVNEFVRRTEEADADAIIAVGECNAQTGAGDPYLPFREVLATLTGADEQNGPERRKRATNRARIKEFVRVASETLLQVGPDLVGIFVPGASLLTKIATTAASKGNIPDMLAERMGKRDRHGATGALEQTKIFEQYAAVLAALSSQRPLVLILDDLHWADGASLNLLFHLARELEASRVLIVGTYRPDDVALGRRAADAEWFERHPLEPLLNELKRYYGEIVVDLDADEARARRVFLEELLDAEPNLLGAAFREQLFLHTEGHPLFTVELLRYLRERGDLERDAEGRWFEGGALDWDAMPARVEGVIEERIARLADDLRETLTIGSVVGLDFTAQVVSRVQNVKERDLIRNLGRELDKRHRLVQEQGEVKVGGQYLARYRFTHALFQQFLYGGLSAGERRLLHRDVAEALEALYEGQTDEIAAQLARHYEESGDAELAVKYLMLAGERARLGYAHAEALDLYRRALVFLEAERDPRPTVAALMKLGQTYHDVFDFAQAGQAYARAFALQEKMERPTRTPRAGISRTLRTSWTLGHLADPAWAGDLSVTAIADQVFSALVQVGPELDIMPDVAHAWEVTGAGRRYVLHLRKDVRWSDGATVTAADYELGLQQALQPDASAPPTTGLFEIKGAQAYHWGQARWEEVGVEVRDPHTLLVELDQPAAYFLYVLGSVYPCPQHAVERSYAGSFDPGQMLTNGPFRVETSGEERLVLVRNPDYHGHSLGNVDRLELLNQDLFEPGEVAARYRAGELDFCITNLAGADAIALAEQGRADELQVGPSSLTRYLLFNTSQPPTDDPLLREALIVSVEPGSASRQPYEPKGGIVPPGIPGHVPADEQRFDPEHARRLLARAGYGGAFRVPPLRMASQGAREFKYLKEQWARHLGVECSLADHADNPLTEPFAPLPGQPPPHLVRFVWFADYPDPDYYLRGALGGVISDPAYQELIAEARRMGDQRARQRLYTQAERILVERSYVMPLGYGQWGILRRRGITTYPTSLMKAWFWKDVVVD